MIENLAPFIVGLVRKKKNKKAPSAAYVGRSGEAAPPVTPLAPTNNANLGTAGAPAFAPPPPVGGGTGSAEWLALALSAIGGGPDRNAYVAPFDAAAQRAQAAHSQALPEIAAGYDRLRSELGTAQAGADQSAAQAQAGMASQQQNNQAQIASLVAPVLAQLQAAGGNAALGSLTGGLQAQVQTGQAQLAQQGQAQTQLSQNLQQAGTQSHQSRLADTQLAQQSATASAGNNLNAVLNALEARKAEALQQYASDSQRHGSQVASAKMEAAERSGENDPGRAIELERARLQLENDRMDFDERRAGPASNVAKQEWTDWHDNLSRSNPVSYDVLYSIMEENDDLATAMAALNKKIAAKQVKTKGGKQLDATFLRDRLREAYDIHDRMTDGEKKTTKR